MFYPRCAQLMVSIDILRKTNVNHWANTTHLLYFTLCRDRYVQKLRSNHLICLGYFAKKSCETQNWLYHVNIPFHAKPICGKVVPFFEFLGLFSTKMGLKPARMRLHQWSACSTRVRDNFREVFVWDIPPSCEITRGPPTSFSIQFWEVSAKTLPLVDDLRGLKLYCHILILIMTGWWFGTMEFYFFHNIGHVIIPTDEYFSEG